MAQPKKRSRKKPDPDAGARRMVSALDERIEEAVDDALDEVRTTFAKVIATTVNKWDVTQATLVPGGGVLDDDDLDLGQWARFYGRNVGFEVGDVLVLVPYEADFVVVDIISDTVPVIPDA